MRNKRKFAQLKSARLLCVNVINCKQTKGAKVGQDNHKLINVRTCVTSATCRSREATSSNSTRLLLLLLSRKRVARRAQKTPRLCAWQALDQHRRCVAANNNERRIVLPLLSSSCCGGVISMRLACFLQASEPPLSISCTRRRRAASGAGLCEFVSRLCAIQTQERLLSRLRNDGALKLATGNSYKTSSLFLFLFSFLF